MANNSFNLSGFRTINTVTALLGLLGGGMDHPALASTQNPLGMTQLIHHLSSNTNHFRNNSVVVAFNDGQNESSTLRAPWVEPSIKENVSTADDEQANLYPLPPPFNKDEFWQKILTLIQLHRGYVTLQDVNRVLGVEMKLGRHDEQVIYHHLIAKSEWFFSVALMFTTEKFVGIPKSIPDGVSSSLSIDWGVNAFGNDQREECILYSTVKQDLQRIGLEVSQFEHHTGNVDYFFYPDATVKSTIVRVNHQIDFSSGQCLKNIRIFGRP